MPSIEDCIKQLEAVRDAAGDPRAAYVIRSRLERLLLSTARLIAEMSHSQAPDIPTRVAFVAGRGAARRLMEVSNALYDQTALICRPSESLDVRWEEGWRCIASALDQLEVELRSQGTTALD